MTAVPFVFTISCIPFLEDCFYLVEENLNILLVAEHFVNWRQVRKVIRVHNIYCVYHNFLHSADLGEKEVFALILFGLLGEELDHSNKVPSAQNSVRDGGDKLCSRVCTILLNFLFSTPGNIF